MKRRILNAFGLSLITLCLYPFEVFADSGNIIDDGITAVESDVIDFDLCKEQISKAELVANDLVYGACGFDDWDIAWSYWGPWASQKKHKRALYQLCKRHPMSEYGMIYCQRAASLGYAPAISAVGDIALVKGQLDLAYDSYTKALESYNLNDDETVHAAEQLGVLHLKEGDYYNPNKAARFFEQASQGRAALANNVLGYLSYSGELGVDQNKEESFKYFWKAILLGCPAAEENLGIFHLARQKKIDEETALTALKQKAYSCDGYLEKKVDYKAIEEEKEACGCRELENAPQKYYDKPAVLLKTGQDIVELADIFGKEVVVLRHLEKLPDGWIVSEIYPTATVLLRGNDRIVLPLYPAPVSCLKACQTDPEMEVVGKVKIKPYRLRFTPEECSDLTYYASFLIDKDKPYVGRQECYLIQSGAKDTDDRLLTLIKDRANRNRPENKPVVLQTAAPVDLEPVFPEFVIPSLGAGVAVPPKEFRIPKKMPVLSQDVSTPQALRAKRLRNIITKRQEYQQKLKAQEEAAEKENNAEKGKTKAKKEDKKNGK